MFGYEILIGNIKLWNKFLLNKKIEFQIFIKLDQKWQVKNIGSNYIQRTHFSMINTIL